MKKLYLFLALIVLLSCEKEQKACYVCETQVYDLEKNVLAASYTRTFDATLEWIIRYENELTCVSEQYYSPIIGVDETIRAKLTTKCILKSNE